MKRSYILLIIAMVFVATSCKKNKELDRELRYNGPNPIEMALRDKVLLEFESDYNVTVSSDNNSYVTILSGGYVYGKNVGEANVKINNYYNEVTIPVKVKLFMEPTFDFGCGVERIIEYEGVPNYNYGDTILIYGNANVTSMFISYTCTQKSYYLSANGRYYESDVYLKSDMEYLLGVYLENNFIFDSTYHVSDSLAYDMYHGKTDSGLKCGKFGKANQWGDYCLFYYRLNGKSVLPRRYFEMPMGDRQ